jgi:hypothetical protein
MPGDFDNFAMDAAIEWITLRQVPAHVVTSPFAKTREQGLGARSHPFGQLFVNRPLPLMQKLQTSPEGSKKSRLPPAELAFGLSSEKNASW